MKNDSKIQKIRLLTDKKRARKCTKKTVIEDNITKSPCSNSTFIRLRALLLIEKNVSVSLTKTFMKVKDLQQC